MTAHADAASNGLKRTHSPSPAQPAKSHAPFKQGSRRNKKVKLTPVKARPEGTHDEILTHELRELHLGSFSEPTPVAHDQTLPEPLQSTVELTVEALSSTGDGIATHPSYPGHTFIVPFCIPGDVVTAKPVRHVLPHASHEPPAHTVCDLLSVQTPSNDRDDSLIRCKYFAKCSGCQFQMSDYDYQLAHKRRIVERAYKYFSALPPTLLPEVQPTMGSPLQYAYRTKLTPHFDGPHGGRRAARKGEKPTFQTVPEIGFMLKGTRKTLDIEECPIGTPSVQKGLVRERARVARELNKYRKGATILLRETTRRVGKDHPTDAEPNREAEASTLGDGNSAARTLEDSTTVVENHETHQDIHTCTSDNHATTTEYISNFTFKNPANAFFQNNNSILPSFTQYIRDQLAPFCQSRATPAGAESRPLRNLIDAYSGSGLFTICLSSLFSHSIGIDISTESITFARTNARLNRVGYVSPKPEQTDGVTADAEGSVRFEAGTASAIFSSVPSHFDPTETAVVIDPPRKGCDEDFLTQLIRFGPRVVIYVSCNVHTQARDIGWLLRNSPAPTKRTEDQIGSIEEVKSLYEISSLRGFDFFPQTGHVEGVAVLSRRDGH